ncbi:MAG: electron transfer flavoprotein-ubiquinone oxidoreductase [Alphaproteobacteria bacterium]
MSALSGVSGVSGVWGGRASQALQREASMAERETMEFDVVIVGGGPSGLSAAIRLAQMAKEEKHEVSICVLEKGSEVGAHILSGAVFEPRALDELIPDWKEKGAPLEVAVTREKFLFLSKRRAFSVPVALLPRETHNAGNYIISLGNFCRWLARQAEALGVSIFPGFPVTDFIEDDAGVVRGVITSDMGRARDGSEKDGFQAGIKLMAKYTIFAEGCRGSVSGRLEEKLGLRGHVQTYGIGLKELWKLREGVSEPGLVMHTAGWPMDNRTWGGSFIYHLDKQQAAIGYVVGLDYRNPWLDPFMEFQRFKQHPAVRPMLEGGERIAYGARALNEGGLQSVPRLAFAGGVLVGCSAGFLNVPKIKGSHTAMKSGILAGEAIFAALVAGRDSSEPLVSYEEAVRASWLWEELRRVRNFRPAAARFGMMGGMLYAALDLKLLGGRVPWTFGHRRADHASLRLASEAKPIDYPSPDGVISFDRNSSVYLANVNHESDQPVHLRLGDAKLPITQNLPRFAEPATRYCPAGVYEVVEKGGEKEFVINAQNCVHCKTCDIKDPAQNITWTTPEGGGGPNYPNM